MNPIQTGKNLVASWQQGYEEGKETVGKIAEETALVLEKSDNLINNGHYTTDDKLQYYQNIDEYNDKVLHGIETSALEDYAYMGSRLIIGDPLSYDELKSETMGIIKKQEDKFRLEGGRLGYFNNYDNILEFDFYMEQKKLFIRNGIDWVNMTDADAVNFSKSLNQGKDGPLSLRLQYGLGLSRNKANKIAHTSCKSGTIYYTLGMNGADTGSYSHFFAENVKKGHLKGSNAFFNSSTTKIVSEYGFKTKTIYNYDDFLNGKGGAYGETRIRVNSEKPYSHSMPAYKSNRSKKRYIKDISYRGNKLSSKLVYEKDSRQGKKEYFQYFQYLDKK